MNTASADDRDLIIICQFAVVSGYRTFFEHLARLNPRRRVHLVVPSHFRELGNQKITCAPLRPEAPDNLILHALPCIAPHVQIMILPGLIGLFRRCKKESSGRAPLVIAMTEPYSVSFLWIWMCLRLSRISSEIWAFTCQNIFKSFRWPLSAIQRLCFRSVQSILACGFEQQQVLRRQGYSGHIMFFPFWYDEGSFFLKEQKEKLASERINVGFCGKIAAEKGVFDLVDALRIGESELKGRVRLCVAGGGPDRPRLETSLSSLASEGFEIIDHGPLSFDRIPAFFAGLDILLVPSRTQSNWKEQFGRVIVEAMACGVTVLGSDSGEIPHVIGDPQRIFKEGDPDSLCECLKRNLLERPSTRSQNNSYVEERYSSRATALALAKEIEAAPWSAAPPTVR